MALALGLVLTVIVTVLASLLVGQVHREAAEERARNIAERLSLQLANAERQVLAIGAHLATMDRLDPAGFATFHRALGRAGAPGAAPAFAFMLAVPHDALAPLDTRLAARRAEFEASGYPPPPRLADAPPAETHFPILLAEPASARERLFGFDLVGARMRRASAERALATGRLALSDPVLLGAPRAVRPFTVLLMAPVALSPAMRRDLALDGGAGLVAASIDPDPLLAATLDRADPGVEALVLAMPGTEGMVSVAAEHAGREAFLRSSHVTEVADIPLGDRSFTLSVRGVVGYNRVELFGLLAVIGTGLMSTLIAVLLTQRSDRERAIVETELARKRAALERAAVSAQQTQHLESLGRLVGGVAHDFNNLMTVILGNLEFLREESAQPTRDALVDEAIRATERGRALTAQLLAFGRRAQLDPRPVDIAAVLHDAGRTIGRILPDNVQLAVEPSVGLWPVEIDRNQIDNAILNLVLNARDAMPEGGTITLSAANLQFGGENGEGGAADLGPGRYVMVAVTDTGHGMDRATVAQAFEPFFTTKTVGEGSGLGLSMVFGFAKQSGGTARIASTPGVGTSVKLFFPAIEREAADGAGAAGGSRSLPRPGAGAAGRTAPGRRSIMVVEDDPAVRRLVAARLRGAGYAVSAAPSGDDALQILLDEPDRPLDLVLTDIVMPGRLQGAALAAEVAALRPDTRIAFLSGYPREMTLGQDRRLADYPLLAKPINGDDLLAAVARILDGQPP